VHTLQIGRAVIVAFGIVLCASPMAKLFGVPQYTPSFMLTSVVLLIRGFNHLGIKQTQRDYNYRPEAISTGVAQAISLTATVVTGYILRDHRAILVAFGVEGLVFAIMTHRLALLPFSVRADPIIGREALAYGLPLIANGIMLAVMSQADRMLVGHYFGIEALADYAVILNIAVVPLSSLYRIVASVALAMLARDREVQRRLEASYLLVAWGFTLVGSVYACGMSLGLDIVVPLIFGKAYM
jgi:O-antigen/teichoic acid export membrane protein